MTDKNLCMSRYLSFRFIQEEDLNFFPGLKHSVWKRPDKSSLHQIDNAYDVDKFIKDAVSSFIGNSKTAVFLSGGIDSAILASYLPKKTKAYTFKCVADGAVSEVEQASKYASAYDLDHEIIEMRWSDFEDLTPELLKADGVPFHSIEVQLLKAAKHAKAAGFDQLILGDGADTLFGGLDGFLSKDRTLDEFRERFAYVKPETVLKNPVDVTDIYRQFLRQDGTVDAESYIHNVFAIESTCSYMHAFASTGLKILAPYCAMRLAKPLNIERIRAGEPKYILRELFAKRYPHIEIPKKIPLPRATDQWLAGWEGPKRDEFIAGCHKNLTGDQKWLVWCLEKFLNAYDNGELI